MILYHAIREMDHFQWIATYDIAPTIKDIYKEVPGKIYSLQYSANRRRKEQEYLFNSPTTKVSSYDIVQLEKIP